MNRVYYIDTLKAKQNTVLDSSISDKTLSLIIKTAHQVYLQELLGSPLYNTLNTNYINSGLTTNQRTLIETYIIDYLYATVEYLAIDELLLKMSDAGINVVTPPNTMVKTKDELLTIRMHKSKAMNFYAGLIKIFVDGNPDLKFIYEILDNTQGVKAKKNNTFGFVTYDTDDDEDELYKRRRTVYPGEESI